MCYSHCNKKATDLVPLSCSPETNLATEENARGIFKLLPDTLAYKCQTKCSMLQKQLCDYPILHFAVLPTLEHTSAKYVAA